MTQFRTNVFNGDGEVSEDELMAAFGQTVSIITSDIREVGDAVEEVGDAVADVDDDVEDLQSDVDNLDSAQSGPTAPAGVSPGFLYMAEVMKNNHQESQASMSEGFSSLQAQGSETIGVIQSSDDRQRSANRRLLCIALVLGSLGIGLGFLMSEPGKRFLSGFKPRFEVVETPDIWESARPIENAISKQREKADDRTYSFLKLKADRDAELEQFDSRQAEKDQEKSQIQEEKRLRGEVYEQRLRKLISDE